jgi:hypothetical protein
MRRSTIGLDAINIERRPPMALVNANVRDHDGPNASLAEVLQRSRLETNVKRASARERANREQEDLQLALQLSASDATFDAENNKRFLRR